jgi:hypothetical protein
MAKSSQTKGFTIRLLQKSLIRDRVPVTSLPPAARLFPNLGFLHNLLLKVLPHILLESFLL